MIPTEFFVLRILSSLIPKSVRAGIALVVTLIFFSAGMHALTDVILNQASAWTVARCVVGIIVGSIAGLVFYYLQEMDGKPKQGDLEIISQYHKDHQRNFDVAWTSEDHKPKEEKKS